MYTKLVVPLALTVRLVRFSYSLLPKGRISVFSLMVGILVLRAHNRLRVPLHSDALAVNDVLHYLSRVVISDGAFHLWMDPC